MTVSTSVYKAGPYAGSGTTGPFTVTFRFLANSHLRVIKTSTTGSETTLNLGVDYSVTGAGGASGTVTLTSPLLTGEKLTIVRNVPLTQETDYVFDDSFQAESHEQALDKLTMITQQLAEEVDRAVKVSPSSTDDPDALIASIKTSEQNAAASAASAAASYDQFDDRYLGAKTSNPTLDNDGNALQVGAEYWNSVSNERRTWTGSAWVSSITVVPDNSVTTTKLADASVTTAKLAGASVTTAKLADGAAVGAKLGSKIQSISASVSGNALTISASLLSLDFRSTTLGSGTVTTVTGTPANLVISSGSTLGTVNAVQSDIAVLAINNAGTIELAAVNLAGGTRLDEANLITTTAEGGAGAADSSTVIYSTTARTNVAYRVVGIIRSTQATAGTWATAPSLIQGAGGQAITAMGSIGYGQTWQDVSGSRTLGTTYYNTTGKPIQVAVSASCSSGTGVMTATVNSLGIQSNSAAAAFNTTMVFIVPAGASYTSDITATKVLSSWYELR
jgi:hypothetical protein